MTPTRLNQLLAAFATKRVCVIGDAMLDEWVYCTSNRESPEAPGVPVLVTSVEPAICLGGAANVAVNVAALQGVSTEGIREHGKPLRGPDQSMWPVLMHGGAAHRALNLNTLCMEAGTIPICCDNCDVITKTRIFKNGAQIARIDREYPWSIAPTKIFRALREHPAFDLILVVDYAKGMVTQALLDGLPVEPFMAIAPKPASNLLIEGTFSLVQVNESERPLVKAIGIQTFLATTAGENGIIIQDWHNGARLTHPSVTRNLVDPCGAGDTTFAALSLALACGATAQEAAELAMHAAAVVCEKPRTAVCGREELIAHLDGQTGQQLTEVT